MGDLEIPQQRSEFLLIAKTSAKTFDSQATQQEKLRPFFQSQLPHNIQFRVNLLNSLDRRIRNIWNNRHFSFLVDDKL